MMRRALPVLVAAVREPVAIAITVAVAITLALSAAASGEGDKHETDGENEAKLVVSQGSCPDFQLAVTVTGDDDSPTDVRIDGVKQNIGNEPGATLDAGQEHVFSQEGEYELDVVDGGVTVNVKVFQIEDAIDAQPCDEPTPVAVFHICKAEMSGYEDTFDFDTNFGADIDIEDGECQGFNASGGRLGVTLRVWESLHKGTHLVDIDCDVLAGVVNYDEDVDEGLAEFVLSDGDELRCTWYNEVDVAPTPVPTVTPLDVCDNIEGAQSAVPPGLSIEIVGSKVNCVVPPTPVPPATGGIKPPSTGDAGLR